MANWFTKQRIEWIVEHVRLHGFINRSDIMERFRISTPQASNDLSAIMQAMPGFMHYDHRRKRYELAQEQRRAIPSGRWLPIELAPANDPDFKCDLWVEWSEHGVSSRVTDCMLIDNEWCTQAVPGWDEFERVNGYGREGEINIRYFLVPVSPPQTGMSGAGKS